MNPKHEDLARLLQQQERERLLQNPPAWKPVPPRPTVHWTELKEMPPGSRIATEWNFYLKQIGRLLAEGREGKWVLIKGEEIIGIWDTQEEAREVRSQRFPLQDVLLQQILEREPILRVGAYYRPWPGATGGLSARVAFAGIARADKPSVAPGAPRHFTSVRR